MRKLMIWGAAATASLFATAAFAIPCPSSLGPTVGRQLDLTVNVGSAACGVSGLGNESASDFPGFAFIEKDDVAPGPSEGILQFTGLGGNSGTWNIWASLWSVYDQISIVFKFGGATGQGTSADPDWISFVLTGGATSGTWGWVPNSSSHFTGLSHVTIYGRCIVADCDPPDRDVPEPGTLGLLGLGLAGLGLGMRRRRKI